jgi:UDP-glucose 4-epimerase
MDTVLVTGGLGRSGRWLVDRLAGDHDVVCLDLDHPGWEIEERPHVTFRAADLTDAGEAAETVAEVAPDAVVHWAALRSPERHAGARVFETNLMAAYNVLVAAGRAGARVVQASSEGVYGGAFARDPPLPERLPMSETHPCRPEDPYGTAKVAAEQVGAMVARRYDVPVLSARPAWIQFPGEYTCRRVSETVGQGNCWSYVDARDVATFVERALAADIEGHEAVHCAAADTYLDRPTVEAVRDHFGAVPAECDLSGTEGPLSLEKARELLGWEPAHAWRTAAEEDVPAPSLVVDG